MRKVRRKKITPRLCSLGSTVWEQEKHLSNTKAHTRHSHRGSESGPANHPVPQPLIRRWSDPLDRLADQSERRRVVGVNEGSVGWGEERKSVSLHCSPGVDCSNSLAKAPVWGSQKKDKNVLSLGRVNAFQFAGYSSVHFGLHYNHGFLCKAVSFSLIESILRL